MQGSLKHGCKECGSIPTTSGNNVNNGKLTINKIFTQSSIAGCVFEAGIHRDFQQGCEVEAEGQKGTTGLIGAYSGRISGRSSKCLSFKVVCQA